MTVPVVATAARTGAARAGAGRVAAGSARRAPGVTRVAQRVGEAATTGNTSTQTPSPPPPAPATSSRRRGGGAPSWMTSQAGTPQWYRQTVDADPVRAANAGGGFVLGLLVYVVALTYLRDGRDGVVRLLKAKFFNQVSAA